MACALAAAMAVAVSGHAQPPAAPAPRFPAAVEEVLVDVVVVDKDGSPIGGLTRDDFVLAEDGTPQAILSFEAVEVAPAASRDPLVPRPTVSAPRPEAVRPAGPSSWSSTTCASRWRRGSRRSGPSATSCGGGRTTPTTCCW